MSFISNVPFVSSMFNVSITLFDERTYSKVLLLLLYFQFEHDRAFLILFIVKIDFLGLQEVYFSIYYN